MKRAMTLWMLLCVLLCGGAAAAVPEAIIFHDPFERLVDKKGVQYCAPTVQAEGAPGGQIVGKGKGKTVPGKKNQALQLTDDTRIIYQNVGHINPLGGSAAFWIKLNFDPNERNEKTRTILRNQMFLTFQAPGKGYFMLYTTLKDVNYIVRNNQRNTLAHGRIAMRWEKDAWHYIEVRWGKQIEMWIDGEKKLAKPWEGIFGPLQIEQEKLRLVIGHPSPNNVLSEFTLDELVICAPALRSVAVRPRMALPLLEGAPTLDGKLDEAFWKQAGKVTGFVAFAKRELKPVQSSVRAAYTKEGLYIGAQLGLPDGRRPAASLTERDASIYREDTLEMFFQPLEFEPSYYQLMASAIGTQMDLTSAPGQRPNMAFNPDWQVKTSATGGEWVAEIFFPFKVFGLTAPPKAGTVWRGNFVLDSVNGFPGASSWAFTDGNFTNPVTFGELLFTGQARTLRLESISGYREGNLTADFRLVGPFPPAITVQGRVYDEAGMSQHEQSVRMNDSKTISITKHNLQAGAYTAHINAVDEAGTHYFSQSVIFSPEKRFSLTVENYPYAGEAVCRAGVGAFQKQAKRVEFRLLSPQGKTLSTTTVKNFRKAVAAGIIKTDALAPAEYAVEAAALDTNGKVIEMTRQTLKIFPRPKWWKNTLGLDHSVPPPWTPVAATTGGYGVWGRDYQFGGAIFPKQITSQNVPLLAGAPRMTLKAGGKTVDLAALRATGAPEQHPDVVTLSAVAEAAGVSVQATGALEFDGCYRYDVTLTPKGPTRLEALTLELPFPRAVGRFLLVSNGMSSSITEITKPFQGGFSPYLWLGNDDMGLAVFTESDQYWQPHDGRMIEVVPSGDTTLLRLNIIRQPLTITQPATLTFGLMASPVQPLPEKNVVFRHLIYNGPEKLVWPDFLTYPAGLRLSTQAGTVEFLVKWTERGNRQHVELFNLLPAKSGITALDCYVNRGQIAVRLGKQVLLLARRTIKVDAFTHIAFTWSADQVALYVAGERVATAKPSAEFTQALKGAAAPGGKLRFGCRQEHRGETAIVLDDIRLSSAARYTGEKFAVPTAPLTKDAKTVLLDPLNETFVPDGQDAWTAAGGVPSIGCRFVPGAHGQGLQIEVAPVRDAGDVSKNLGATFGLAWNWNTNGRSQFGWPPVLMGPVGTNVPDRIKRFHEDGLQIMPYHAYPAIGGPSPLVEQFGHEWARKPISILPYPPPEGHYMLNASLSAKGFADYLTAGAAWAMENLGFDGIYTDGIGGVERSQNLYQRAGYIDAEGNPRPTVPIFGAREAMKRLYRVVKARKRDGLVVNHVSYNLMLPTMSFSDIYYTGEHEDYTNLSHVRLRFSSKPWGLQASLLGASSHIYSSLHIMVGLIHGTPLMGHGPVSRNDEGRKLMNLRKAYLDFGIRDAQWVPYFRNEDAQQRFCKGADPKVKTSLYYYTGKRALLIIANFNKQDKIVDLQLSLDAMGLNGKKLKGETTLTKTPVSLAGDGRLSVPVRSQSFVLVTISTDN